MLMFQGCCHPSLRDVLNFASLMNLLPKVWRSRGRILCVFFFLVPRCSMYGIFTYICAIFGVNVGKYSIHGASGVCNIPSGKLTVCELENGHRNS